MSEPGEPGPLVCAELRTILGRDPGRVTVEPLRHNQNNPVTVDVSRYRGADWSVVGKHVGRGGAGAAHWSPSDDPQHWNYWRREALAYTSGLAASAYAGSGIAGPRLLLAADRPAGGTMLWLADARGLPGSRWSVDDLGRAARALGRGQGSYLAGRPLPDAPWLSRRFLRQYVAAKPVDGSVLHDDAAWRVPVVRAAYGSLQNGLRGLWEDRERLLALVESLPQTLAHCDVWPANMITGAGGDVVLLDWSFVGVGAVGEDAGNLVTDSVWDGWLPAVELPHIGQVVWESYLVGLREAGWTGDERLARLGFCAGGAVKYAWLAEQSLRRVAAGDLRSYGGYSDIAAEKLLNTYAAAFVLLLSWVDEARSAS